MTKESIADRLKREGFEVPPCNTHQCMWCGKTFYSHEYRLCCSVSCDIHLSDNMRDESHTG